MRFDHRLAAEFMFDEQDLWANRNGRFSDSQRRLLVNTVAAVRRPRPGLKVALFVLFGALVVLSAAVVAGSGGSGAQFAIVIAILAGFGAVIGGLRRQMASRAARMLTAPLQVVAGTAAVSLHTSGGASALTSYRLTVGDRRFVLDSSRADAFVNGSPYRVYFIEALAGPMILSVEAG